MNLLAFLSSLKDKVMSFKSFLVMCFASAFALLFTNSAFAAELNFDGASAELGGVKTAIVAIIGTLVVILGIGIAWSYFKRTAK